MCAQSKFFLTTHAYSDIILRKLTQTSARKRNIMAHINTINTRNLHESAVKGGCGECQTSCQSASKTSCSVANQKCEQCKKNND